jgi:DNA-binding GntR family transcriptional regulator
MNSAPELTLRQKAYVIIQEKLLNGDIRAGDLISELALAEVMGMSRTPVREAIGQLELEGLFDKVARVGTQVRLPNQRELSELYGVREALESHAAAVAANVLSASKLTAMERWHRDLKDLIEEMQAEQLEVLDEALLHRFFDADIGFHSTIVGATDNQRTLKIVNEFRVVQRVFEYGRMAYTLNLVESAMREHGEILGALLRGDSDKARFAMAAHIRSSREHAMERFSVEPIAFDELANNGTRGHSRLKQRSRRRSPAIA